MNSTEKANAKRILGQFGIPGPVASLALSSLGAAGGGQASQRARSGRQSDSSGSLNQRTRFLTTKTGAFGPAEQNEITPSSAMSDRAFGVETAPNAVSRQCPGYLFI